MKKMLFPLLILPVIWGSYYVSSQVSLQYVSTFTLGVLIRFITMVLLTIILVFRQQFCELFHVSHVWPKLLCIGIMGFLLDTTAFLGLQMAPVGIGTVLLKCDILFVNLISVVVYKEKLRCEGWIATFVMLAGVVMVMGVDLKNLNILNFGNIFFILSALFVSINAFLIKSAQKDPVNPVSDNVVAFYNNFITLILFSLTNVIVGGFSEISGMKGKGLLIISLAGIGQTLIYQVYYYNLRNVPVWIVKIFLLLMPIVSCLLSYVLFHSTMTVTQLIGMAVVLLGAFFIIFVQKDALKAEESAV